MQRNFLIRVPIWLPLVALILLLTPTEASARTRPWASVTGLITEVLTRGGAGIVTIEAGNQILQLKVTAQTRIGRVGPPPDGPDEHEIKLEPGRYAETSYNPVSRKALSISVSEKPVVSRVTGTLTAVGPLNTITIAPNGGGAEQQWNLADYSFRRSRLFAGPLTVRPEQLPLLVGLPVDLLHGVGSTEVERLRAILPPAVAGNALVRKVLPENRVINVQFGGVVTDLAVPEGLEIEAARGVVPLDALELGDRLRVQAVTLPSGALLLTAARLNHVVIRTVTGKVTLIEPESHLLQLQHGGLKRFVVLDGTPILFQDDDGFIYPVSLSELAGPMQQYQRVQARVEYLVRGRVRVATRIEATGVGLLPPPDPN